MQDRSVIQNGVHRVPRRINGNAEADVLRVSPNRHVDANHIAIYIKQWTAGIAWVDSGVRLNQIDIIIEVGQRAPDRADDTEGDCMTESQWRADCNSEIAG